MAAEDVVNAPPGSWLRGKREAAGLTREELAELSGVSVRAISDLERGLTRKPHPRSVRALAGALGLPETLSNDLIARYRSARDADLGWRRSSSWRKLRTRGAKGGRAPAPSVRRFRRG